MPWKIGHRTDKGWPILRSDTGQIVGFSKTRGKAKASVRARYAESREFIRSHRGYDLWMRRSGV